MEIINSFPRDKGQYLKSINQYEDIFKAVPAMIQNHPDTLYKLANQVGLSNSALSNKIYGRREWKSEDIKKVIDIIGTKEQKVVVRKYIAIVEDILPIIKENGYKLGFVFEKAGMTHTQYQVRTRSLDVWQIDEVRRIIEVLKF